MHDFGPWVCFYQDVRGEHPTRAGHVLPMTLDDCGIDRRLLLMSSLVTLRIKVDSHVTPSVLHSPVGS